MTIERPLDLLDQCKGKEITITCKDGNEITGTLIAFDMHINIAINTSDLNQKNKKKKNLFVRGDTVVFVEEGDGRI